MKRVLILPAVVSVATKLQEWKPSGFQLPESSTSIFDANPEYAIDQALMDAADHVHSSQSIVQHFIDSDLQEWSDDHTKEKEEPLDPATRPKKCYGVALSDATDLGPYEAGALIGLL
jgi:hypothetical protein